MLNAAPADLAPGGAKFASAPMPCVGYVPVESRVGVAELPIPPKTPPGTGPVRLGAPLIPPCSEADLVEVWVAGEGMEPFGGELVPG